MLAYKAYIRSHGVDSFDQLKPEPLGEETRYFVNSGQELVERLISEGRVTDGQQVLTVPQEDDFFCKLWEIEETVPQPRYTHRQV